MYHKKVKKTPKKPNGGNKKKPKNKNKRSKQK